MSTHAGNGEKTMPKRVKKCKLLHTPRSCSCETSVENEECQLWSMTTDLVLLWLGRLSPVTKEFVYLIDVHSYDKPFRHKPRVLCWQLATMDIFCENLEKLLVRRYWDFHISSRIFWRFSQHAFGQSCRTIGSPYSCILFSQKLDAVV